MISKFIQDITSINYWDLIFRKNTEFAYYTINNVYRNTKNAGETEIDVICITLNLPEKEREIQHIVWNGINIKFRYFKVDAFDSPSMLYGRDVLTLLDIEGLKENNTVFFCKNESLLNELIARSETFVNSAFERLANLLSSVISKVLKEGSLLNKRPIYLERLIYAKKKVFKEPVNEEYLNQLRQIKIKKLDPEYEQMCIEDLKDIKAFMDTKNIATLEIPITEVKRECALEVSGKGNIDSSNIYTATVNTTISPKAKDIEITTPYGNGEVASYDNLTGAVKVVIRDDGSNIINGRIFGIVRWNK